MINEAVQPHWQARKQRWVTRAGRAVGILTSLTVAVLITFIVVVAVLPLFGYRTSIVYGGSMEPAIDRGALLIGRSVDPQTLAVGDIITFRRDDSAARVTHRIVAAREQDGQRFFTVRGDANDAPDPGEMSFTSDVEKVVLDIPYAGFVLGFSRSLQGMILLVVLPAIALAMVQVMGMGRDEQETDTT